MNKSDAIKAFGGVRELAAALGVRSRQAIYKKPEQLSQEDADRITGAAIRLGVDISHKPRGRRRKKAA